MTPSATTNPLRQPGSRPSAVEQHGVVRRWLRTGLSAVLGALFGACQPAVEPPSRTEVVATSAATGEELGPPDITLIRFACAGFDAAVAAEAPPDRLLSHTATHAVELGGPQVELATRRWALLPPQGLLEEISRYERTGVNPDECAGLRLHLERLAIISGSR